MKNITQARTTATPTGGKNMSLSYADGQLIRSEVLEQQLENLANIREHIHQGCDPGLEIIIKEEAILSQLDLAKPPVTALNTQDFINDFLTYKADVGAADGYIQGLRRRLMPFARQYPQLPTTPEIIRSFLRQFKTSDVPTRQDNWKALSMLYKFTYDTYGLQNPMLRVEKPRFKKKPGQRLSQDQAKSLLSALKTDFEWALVTCYFGLRFRRVEAERLRFGDIKSDYIIVMGKERTEELPLLTPFRDKLLRLQNNHSPSDPLFSIKADTMAYHIQQVFKRAGITGVRGSPHTLRNTAGALWSMFGGDWTSNRQLLRHSAKTMTDHYAPLTIDELRLKDEQHNPMLNLMRQLGYQVPAPTFQNTTGGRARSIPSFIPSWLTFLAMSGTAARLWLMPPGLASR